MHQLSLIDDVLKDTTRKWWSEPPAREEAIQTLQHDAGIELPPEYLDFLRASNGGEGKFGVQPGWFQLWPAEEVMEGHLGYEVPQYLPSFFAFAGSGGGDLFVFDTRLGMPYQVLAVPCIGMWELEYAHMIGEGFESFIRQIGRLWEPKEV